MDCFKLLVWSNSWFNNSVGTVGVAGLSRLALARVCGGGGSSKSEPLEELKEMDGGRCLFFFVGLPVDPNHKETLFCSYPTKFVMPVNLQCSTKLTEL